MSMGHYDKQRLEQQERELKEWGAVIHSSHIDPTHKEVFKDIIKELAEIRADIENIYQHIRVRGLDENK